VSALVVVESANKHNKHELGLRAYIVTGVRTFAVSLAKLALTCSSISCRRALLLRYKRLLKAQYNVMGVCRR